MNEREGLGFFFFLGGIQMSQEKVKFGHVMNSLLSLWMPNAAFEQFPYKAVLLALSYSIW